MTTDFQRGRESLGTRLNELRAQAGLTGRQLADRLGWPHSKISKLENGRQTASPDDLNAWAAGTDQPETASELKGRLQGMESHTRSWRRQLAAGHRAVQEAIGDQHRQTNIFRGYVGSVIPGIFQTPDYARHLMTRYAALHGGNNDIEDGVRARLRRQEGLYQQGKGYRVLIWEAALRSLVCPPDVLAAQLDRLSGVLGLDTVSLGIIPLGAPMQLASGDDFWIHDDRLVIAETWHAELWLDAAEDVALYGRIWETLHQTAVHGLEAHRLIIRAQNAL